MSVFIKFEPDNGNGLVAEGTFLWDAAKRLGVKIPGDCNGTADCETCLVEVKEGAELLSPPTSAEIERLGELRLAAGERLACQTKVEHSGDVVIQLVTVVHKEKTFEEAARDFRRDFRELPLKKKLTRLVEFEAVTAYETLTSVATLPFTVGEKILDAVARFEKKRHQPGPTSQSDSDRDRDYKDDAEDGPIN